MLQAIYIISRREEMALPLERKKAAKILRIILLNDNKTTICNLLTINI